MTTIEIKSGWCQAHGWTGEGTGKPLCTTCLQNTIASMTTTKAEPQAKAVHNVRPDGWVDTDAGREWLADFLKRLNDLRNELDAATFGSSQRYRVALYPLNDCVGILEDVQ